MDKHPHPLVSEQHAHAPGMVPATHGGLFAFRLSWPRPPIGLHLAVALWVVMVACLFVMQVAWYRHMRAEADLSRYRVMAQDVAGTIRMMHARARSQRRGLELRIDAARGVLYLSAVSRGKQGYTELEQTIWLPAGLQITEAPVAITAQPNGTVTPASILLTAPAYRRLFRLTATAGGLVELYEEPTS